MPKRPTFDVSEVAVTERYGHLLDTMAAIGHVEAIPGDTVRVYGRGRYRWTRVGLECHQRYRFSTPMSWARSIATGAEPHFCVGCRRDMRTIWNGATWGPFRLCLACNATGVSLSEGIAALFGAEVVARLKEKDVA